MNPVNLLRFPERLMKKQTVEFSSHTANLALMRNCVRKFLNSYPFSERQRLLMVLGDIVCGWLLLRGAEVALEKLGGDVSDKDKAFYEGKVAAAQFFARNQLPKITAERQIAEATDLSLMDLPEASF